MHAYSSKIINPLHNQILPPHFKSFHIQGKEWFPCFAFYCIASQQSNGRTFFSSYRLLSPWILFRDEPCLSFCFLPEKVKEKAAVSESDLLSHLQQNMESFNQSQIPTNFPPISLLSETNLVLVPRWDAYEPSYKYICTGRPFSLSLVSGTIKNECHYMCFQLPAEENLAGLLWPSWYLSKERTTGGVRVTLTTLPSSLVKGTSS